MFPFSFTEIDVRFNDLKVCFEYVAEMFVDPFSPGLQDLTGSLGVQTGGFLNQMGPAFEFLNKSLFINIVFHGLFLLEKRFNCLLVRTDFSSGNLRYSSAFQTSARLKHSLARWMWPIPHQLPPESPQS